MRRRSFSFKVPVGGKQRDIESCPCLRELSERTADDAFEGTHGAILAPREVAPSKQYLGNTHNDFFRREDGE